MNTPTGKPLPMSEDYGGPPLRTHCCEHNHQQDYEPRDDGRDSVVHPANRALKQNLKRVGMIDDLKNHRIDNGAVDEREK